MDIEAYSVVEQRIRFVSAEAQSGGRSGRLTLYRLVLPSSGHKQRTQHKSLLEP